jgi:formylmethanofuran dehydrogenase subunit B
MSEIDPSIRAPAIAIVEAATCLACGCLCDDIRVVVESGRVVEAGNACAIGRPWFRATRPGEGLAASTIDGAPAGFDRAIGRAAEILAEARAPMIWGLSGTTIETVASALAIADAIGAAVDPAGSAGRESGLRAFQRVGQVSSTLGEVKDRADLVVFWGVDPIVTHPRHWERYSVEPRGRFIAEGRAGRTVVVVDHGPTATSAASDLFVPVPRDRRGEALWVLRALVQGLRLDPERVGRSTGCAFEVLADLAGRMTRARYGAFFFGSTGSEGPGGPWAAEAALTLVRDLNQGRRFVGLSMGTPGNPGGAEAVLTWQAGAPSAVDYGRGFPRHLPGEATLAARLGSGAIDAALIVADDPATELPPDLLARMAGVRIIRVSPGATRPGFPSAVAFDVARPGIEAGGTVARVDGVMLPLRPAIPADVPTDREILDELRRRLSGLLGPSGRAPRVS